jgi:hypothetical protein
MTIRYIAKMVQAGMFCWAALGIVSQGWSVATRSSGSARGDMASAAAGMVSMAWRTGSGRGGPMAAAACRAISRAVASTSSRVS